jgi:hypothetical protein
MTGNEERVRELCERIVQEQDGEEMIFLLQQLNQELEHPLPERSAEGTESNREMTKSA